MVSFLDPLSSTKAVKRMILINDIVPWGFRNLLQYIADRYTRADNIPIYITENGFPIQDEDQFSREEAINDLQRQTYYAGYLRQLFEASRDDGINIGGYMAWSLLE